MSLAIREIQINTTIRYHLIPVWMAVINKSINKYWRCGEKETPVSHWLWECRLVQPLWKTVWHFLKKKKKWNCFMTQRFHCWEYTLRTLKYQFKNLCTPLFIAVLFTIAKCWKQPKWPSVDEWIKKLWYICTKEYYAAERKNSYLLWQHGRNWRLLC